jgi:hypothetical protein
MSLRFVALLSIVVAVGCQGSAAREEGGSGEKAAAPAGKAGRPAEKSTAPADRSAPVEKPEVVQKPEPPPTPEPTPEPILVPAGTTLTLVFKSSVSSATARPEDAVTALLGEDVKVDNEVVLPQDSEVRGHVLSAKRSGKVSGKAELSVEFDRIVVNGRTYMIDTTAVDQIAKDDHGRDAKIIGGAGAAGAIIGGIAGGGSGALKGVLIGGAAGTGGVLATRGKEVVFEQGSRHKVKLEKGLRLR